MFHVEQKVIMNTKEIKDFVMKMDVKSDEFFELYNLISDKYFDFGKNPDPWQSAMTLIHKWMNRSCNNFEEQVIVVAKVVEQVFLMRYEKTKSCTGTLGFKDETFFFDIYTSETEKDKMKDMLIKAQKGLKNGKFGKNYFKKA